MQKNEKRKKIIQRVLSVLSVVVILVCVVVVPVSATSLVEGWSQKKTVYALTPISTITLHRNLHLFDVNSDEGEMPEFNKDMYFTYSPQNEYLVSPYFDKDEDWYNERYGESFLLTSPTDLANLSSYGTYTEFYATSNYLNGAYEKYPNDKFLLSRTHINKIGDPTTSGIQTITVNFDNLIYYEYGMPAPYFVFDRDTFDYSNTDVKVEYSYELLTVVGEAYDFISETRNVIPTGFSSSGRVDLIPNVIRSNENKSPYIIKNLVVNIKFYQKGSTAISSDYGKFYLQQGYADKQFGDLENIFNNYAKITKWREVSDLTGWIGDTASGFFDVEIFPNIKLSYVLGIILTVSIATWILKLMAGG